MKKVLLSFATFLSCSVAFGAVNYNQNADVLPQQSAPVALLPQKPITGVTYKPFSVNKMDLSNAPASASTLAQ